MVRWRWIGRSETWPPKPTVEIGLEFGESLGEKEKRRGEMFSSFSVFIGEMRLCTMHYLSLSLSN